MEKKVPIAWLDGKDVPEKMLEDFQDLEREIQDCQMELQRLQLSRWHLIHKMREY